MYKIDNLTAFLILIFLINEVTPRRLIFVQETFRHGARYPIQSMSKDKSDFVIKENQYGELTSQGKHMHYILGKAMYEQYWKKLFAGTEYENKYHQSQLYVKSTNVNRTIQSAQSHIQGLLEKLPREELPIERMNYSLPPYIKADQYVSLFEDNQTKFNVYGDIVSYFHPIPIHTEKENAIPQSSSYKYRANPYDEGDFLVKFDFLNCPNQNFWSKQNLASSDAVKIKNSDQVSDFLQELGKAVSSDVKYEDAYHYIDDFQTELYLGKPHLPLFDNPTYQKTSCTYYSILEFIFLTSALLTFFYKDDQIKVSNTRMLQTILYQMKEAIDNKGPKFVIFSAHDTTILSLASAFKFLTLKCVMSNFYDGVDNSEDCINKYPQFATNLVLQLWQEDNLSHTIKILYNGVQRKIPFCGNRYSCSLAEFESWANDFYIEDPNDTCGIREQYTKLYIVIGVLSLFILVFVIIEMSSRFKKKLQKKMEQMEEKKGYMENFEEKDNHFQMKAHA